MERITVQEVAKRMNASPQFVRLGLQQGKFNFGYAVKTSSKWTYWISKERFEAFEREGAKNG